jgi:CTP synthase
MQLAIIEVLRNVAGITNAGSTEFGLDCAPAISKISEWKRVDGGIETRLPTADIGGTMRLGAYPCKLTDDSFVRKIYGDTLISERHRHRYEFNAIEFGEALEKTGTSVSGASPDGTLVEIVERRDHPWFVGVQFHPEFKSRPLVPHPLFDSLIEFASGS